MKAVGLTPPAFSNTMGDLKKRLGVYSLPDTALISAEHAKYLADMAGPWKNEKEKVFTPIRKKLKNPADPLLARVCGVLDPKDGYQIFLMRQP